MESSSTSESSEDSDSDFENSIQRKFKQPAPISKPPPKSLPNFAAACDRTSVSCRAAAMIVSAALDDIEGQNANVIDKNKVTREKQKSRKQFMDSNENANIISLYFDSRKDRTLLMEEFSSVARGGGGGGGLEPSHWPVKYAKSHVFGGFEADFL